MLEILKQRHVKSKEVASMMTRVVKRFKLNKGYKTDMAVLKSKPKIVSFDLFLRIF